MWPAPVVVGWRWVDGFMLLCTECRSGVVKVEGGKGWIEYRKLKVCGKRGHTVRISEPTKSKSGARVGQKLSKEFLNVTHTKAFPRVIFHA